jgi:prepilin-type N-terminal cleavage/methylation domain-containing protein
MRSAGRDGFTLLEVMVAMAVLGVAVVAVLQLSSQSLRLIRVAGEHQDAAQLGDRLLRAITPDAEQVDTGAEGDFSWERRVTAVEVNPDLTSPGVAPPRLFSVSVLVRWGRNQAVELATLRTAPPEGLPGRTP